ncbi:MAG: DUF748 domain-containing protein [Candidatus Omnitrophica bacterium]|nr:DUF748 domain-containing protein [Candidatus Omnitrophota bacterium]
MINKKKLLPEVLLIALGACSVLVLAVYVFVSLNYRAMVASGLKGLTSKDISVGSSELRFPLTVTLNDLKVEDLFEAKEFRVGISVIGLIFGDLVFSEVYLGGPKLTMELNKPLIDSEPQLPGDGIEAAAIDVSKIPLPPAAPSVSEARAVAEDETPTRGFVIKRLRVKDGSIDIVDRNAGPEGLLIYLNAVNADIENFYFAPEPVITNFNISARMPWQGGGKEGSFNFAGWMNLFQRDMQADLNINGIDGVYLSPYYSEWVDVEGARINEAYLNFSSNLSAANNNLTARCHLELTDIKFNPRPEGEEFNKAEKITSAVLDIFREMDKGKVELNFTLNTTMDKPGFGINTIRQAVDEKIARRGNKLGPEDLLALPIKFLSNALKGTIKSTAEISRALVGGTIEIGREMKKSVEGAFSKDETELKDIESGETQEPENKSSDLN